MIAFLIELNRYILPVLAIALLLGCMISLLRKRSNPPPEAWLINAVNGVRINLERWENSIGRHNRCDIVLSYDIVSRFHAVIACRKKGWIVIDTDSSTGTMVNGERIGKSRNWLTKQFAAKSHPLRCGDKICFGPLVFTFQEELEI
ncbi:MAG: FHA domain-containing protein [Oscillospiraceae bacterium]|jgi:pSer/pThr/pTyr-binding forkhead associated (FHA) protein|nr:FHA domain-containing protein [Oscillospiraceae bacterium]